MKTGLLLLGFGLAFGCSSASEPPSDLSVNLLNWLGALGGDPVQYSIIKDVLEGVLGKIEGNQKWNISELILTKGNRLENINIESSVSKVHLDMNDRPSNIKLQNLTVPIVSLAVTGRYDFDGIVIPGGPTVYGKGDVRINFDNLFLSLAIAMKHTVASGKWKVSNLQVVSSVEKSSFWLDNFMDGEPFGEFLNKMIDGVIPMVVNMLPDIVRENDRAVMDAIEALLNGLMPKP